MKAGEGVAQLQQGGEGSGRVQETGLGEAGSASLLAYRAPALTLSADSSGRAWFLTLHIRRVVR